MTPPPRALWLRALLLERERVANHLGDLGYLGNDVALPFGLMQFMRLREDWLRLNARLFGHRLLMDRVVPGGVAIDLDEEGARALGEQGDALERERLLLLARRDVVFREGEPPLVALFDAARVEDLPVSLATAAGFPRAEPPLVVRRADGRHTPELAAVRLSMGFPPGDLAPRRDA